MLDLLNTGNYDSLQRLGLIMLVLWLIMCGAVLVDLWAGVTRARINGEVIHSYGLRRTCEKLGSYWRIQLMGLTVDIVGSLVSWYSLPYASIVITLGVLVIEAISVWENEKSKRGNSEIVKLPLVIKEIIKCSNPEEAKELLNKMEKMNIHGKKSKKTSK